MPLGRQYPRLSGPLTVPVLHCGIENSNHPRIARLVQAIGFSSLRQLELHLTDREGGTLLVSYSVGTLVRAFIVGTVLPLVLENYCPSVHNSCLFDPLYQKKGQGPTPQEVYFVGPWR